MELNVDVIDNETGEIYREGVLLANAHIFIAKENGKIVRDEVDNIDLDDIDGGGQMEVHDIFVDFPEVDLASEEEMRRRAAAWWQYEKGGGRAWSDDEIKEFAKQLMGAR